MSKLVVISTNFNTKSPFFSTGFNGLNLYSMCLNFLTGKKKSFLFIIFLLSITFWIHYSFKKTNSLFFWLSNYSNLAHIYCFHVPSNHSLLLTLLEPWKSLEITNNHSLKRILFFTLFLFKLNRALGTVHNAWPFTSYVTLTLDLMSVSKTALLNQV